MAAEREQRTGGPRSTAPTAPPARLSPGLALRVLTLQRQAGNRAVTTVLPVRQPRPAVTKPSLAPVDSVPSVQRVRTKNTRYNRIEYNRSKFRFIRWRRRSLGGYLTANKAGVNLLTVKYKKGSKAYYLTTRSVPNTAPKRTLRPGHSEQRFGQLKARFEQKHQLTAADLQWAATEREPCGHGPGLAECRHTLASLGIPDNRVYFASEYVEGEDVRTSKGQTPSQINQVAQERREQSNSEMARLIARLAEGEDSEAESEAEDNVEDEYESDYEGDEKQPRRKRAVPAWSGNFRQGR